MGWMRLCSLACGSHIESSREMPSACLQGASRVPCVYIYIYTYYITYIISISYISIFIYTCMYISIDIYTDISVNKRPPPPTIVLRRVATSDTHCVFRLEASLESALQCTSRHKVAALRGAPLDAENLWRGNGRSEPRPARADAHCCPAICFCPGHILGRISTVEKFLPDSRTLTYPSPAHLAE